VAQFLSGTTVTLAATPNVDSVFYGWEGNCGGTGTCSLTMDGAKSSSARFNTAWPVRLEETSALFPGIQPAYGALPDTTSWTFQTRAQDYGENLSLNRNIALRLMGGYTDGGFTTDAGLSVLHGTLTITAGSLTIGKFVIR
jgi:hypothetical protein